MNTNHDLLHRDEQDLRSLAMTELQAIYGELGLMQEERDILSVPRRSFTVGFPVKMTTGQTRIFTGYRVQYNDARGTAKGGIRFPPDRAVEHATEQALLMALNFGVVVSYFEWSQNLSNDTWPEEKVIERLKQVMIAAFNDVYGHRREAPCRMRKAANELAVARILKTEKLRGNL